MLALVKKPHIELSIHGENVDELLNWIKKKYNVDVLSTDEMNESVPVAETEFWKEMEKNRIGNLIAGARLKAGLTQAELSRKLKIRQNMVSDYERGKRFLSPAMAKKFSKVLKIKEERLTLSGSNL